MQQPCGHVHRRAALIPPCILRNPCCVFKSAAQQGRSISGVCLAKGQSYHVEVTVNEDEDPEGVYKRFRNSCNLAGMVYEARRRQRFENRQDIKKRKQQEKGQKKFRDMREKYLETYEEIHTDTPPFVDLFTGEDDMYDITGEINPRRGNYVSRDSMDGLDEDDDEEGGVNGHTPPVKGSAKRDPDAPSRPAQRPDPKTGMIGRNSENFSRRSVVSQGPAENVQAVSTNDNSTKNKPQVETARKRRTAKQQVAQDSRPVASAGVGSKPVKGGGKGKGKAKK